MGFLSGRVTYERFQVGGKGEAHLGPKSIEKLEQHAIGAQGAIAADGIEMGFIAGEHILDLEFSLEKNLVNDALVAAMRVDATKIPADLKRAYYQMELAVLAADNPSGYPTKRQKADAKQAAEERCAAEAESGKFRQMRQVPWLWDSRQNVVYLGTSSQNSIERFVSLFREAFNKPLTRISAGVLAHEIATELKMNREFEDLDPSPFSGPVDRKYAVSWVTDEQASRDFLGNEFLLWLWWVLDAQTDTIRLNDESSAVCMMSKTLSLECPLAQTGRETINHESPIRLPEAKRAVLAGKLPRKSGLIVVRHEEQYELTVMAESLGVSGAALPKLDVESDQAERQDRVDQIRHLTETLDLLFGAFVRRRLSSKWEDDLKKLRVWMKKEAPIVSGED